MKKFLFPFFIFGCFNLFKAQAVFTPTILPQNPTASDNIRIITKAVTPNQGSKLPGMITVSSPPNRIVIRNCYWEGMLTSPKFFIDTVSISALSQGAWDLRFTAFFSTDQQNCVPSDSDWVEMTFLVLAPTSLQEYGFDKKLQVFPNPAGDIIHFSPAFPAKEITIVSADGNFARKIELSGERSVNTSDLAPGIYFIRFKEKEKVRVTRFIKE